MHNFNYIYVYLFFSITRLIIDPMSDPMNALYSEMIITSTIITMCSLVMEIPRSVNCCKLENSSCDGDYATEFDKLDIFKAHSYEKDHKH